MNSQQSTKGGKGKQKNGKGGKGENEKGEGEKEEGKRKRLKGINSFSLTFRPSIIFQF